MQTIQLKVDDSSVGIVMTLIENLKKDIVKEVKIINTSIDKSDKQKKLDQVKGILKNRIADPMAYQRTLRSEWERT